MLTVTVQKCAPLDTRSRFLTRGRPCHRTMVETTNDRGRVDGSIGAHSLTPTKARVAGHNIDEAPVLVNGGVTAATMLAVVLVALSKSLAVVCADTRQSTSFFQLLVVSSMLSIFLNGPLIGRGTLTSVRVFGHTTLYKGLRDRMKS